jgi:hypothetical protein
VKQAEAEFAKAVKKWARNVKSGDAYMFGNTRVQFHLSRKGVMSMPIHGVKEMTPEDVFKEYYKGPETEPRKVG